MKASMLRGKELFDRAGECPSPAAFWWLGQASYLVKLGSTLALIDPFLTEMEGRRVPPLLRAEDAGGKLDVVFCTHDHIDHLDPEAVTTLAQHTKAKFIAPRAHQAR